jgi:iron complex transport system ATP-binding protein
MIELRDVALSIGGRKLLTGVDASIPTGEFVALLGPNGVGKTTLLRAIAGLHALDWGEITLDGVSTVRLDPLQRARRLAFVTSDEIMFDALGVADVVAIGRFSYHHWWQWQTRDDDRGAVAAALAAVKLEGFADRLLSTLSAGERQRVWIALGLAQQTPILLVDEPTSHLDVRVAHEILALLHRQARSGKTVVCALHDLNEAAAYADRIALLAAGKLCALEAPQTLLSGSLLERAYGIAMERIALPGGRLRVLAHEALTDAPSAPAERRNRAPSG